MDLEWRRRKSKYFIHKSLINLNELCQGDEAENYIVLSPKTIPGYKNLSFSCEKCSFSGIFHQAYLADNTGVLESTQSFHQCLQCSRCGESWKPPSYLGLILHGQGQYEPKMIKITPGRGGEYSHVEIFQNTLYSACQNKILLVGKIHLTA